MYFGWTGSKNKISQNLYSKSISEKIESTCKRYFLKYTIFY